MSDRALIGGDILRLITAGMYDNPLVIYREYLQNAADAIAARNGDDGSVLVSIDPINSRVTILDNGIGLSPIDAALRLVPIGNSTKTPGVDRGLRGVGRLAALAFADELHFTTRARASDPVTRVSWDGRALREMDLQHIDAKTAVEACTSTCTVPDDSWPRRFFHVTTDRVTRHAASTLLNQDVVRRYISEVCPVPFDSSFPLAAELGKFLSEYTDYFAFEVCINENLEPIVRPFGAAVPLTEQFSAAFERLETRVIPQLDCDAPAAVLWLAHTPYAGSISRRLGIRGLRARVGNIQVGSEDIFEHMFHETRFNGWCVGEIHIVDDRIVPNGRRDYFETGPHLRNLENHIGAIAHEISLKCRRASSHRNQLRKFQAAIGQATRARELAKSGYLHEKDAAQLLSRENQRVKEVEFAINQIESAPQQAIRTAMDMEEVRECSSGYEISHPLKGVSAESISTLKSVFGTVVRTMPPDSAYDLIQAIISEQYTGQYSQDSE